MGVVGAPSVAVPAGALVIRMIVIRRTATVFMRVRLAVTRTCGAGFPHCERQQLALVPQHPKSETDHE